ncbi:MAG TPA: tetratricopeptide repeat protein [Pirellulales bacterium]|nr:tetratricopeptide repeat protein [Pirellulales bacterium]
MATAAAPNDDNSKGSGKEPLSPAKRSRLQKFFEQGSKVAASGQFDYATEMYTQCVSGDPGNPLYVRSFLANLQKKYNNNKKGSAMAGLKTAGTKGSIKKSVMQKNWLAVITTGLEVLKVNPWDAGALIDIANACEQLEFDECQLEYLKMAFEADNNDVNTNRVYARALGRLGHFDEALNAWQRVKNVKPTDEEATRSMSNLSVEKTIRKGGYEEATSTKDVRASKFAADDEDTRLSPEERLLRAIDKEPAATAPYIELNDLYQRDERFDKAEEILTRALEASGGDVLIRERLEDVQLRRAKQQLLVAEKKAREERTEEAIGLYKRIASELNSTEIKVYSSRCDRYPTNIGYKYELAVRLKRSKKFNEAIKLFQECRSDLKRKGHVYFFLGECFAQLKQYKLALTNFELAAKEIPEREMDERKEATYLAGKLAIYLKDYETAEKHFSNLASLDFGFKDVAQWLDKLHKFRENGGELAPE